MKTIVLAILIGGALLFTAETASADAIGVFSTGVIVPGSPQQDGLTDLHYTLIGVPAGADTGSVFVTSQSGFPFPNWLADDSTSKWISPQVSYAGGEADSSGTYVYQTTFSLAGLNPFTASLQLRFASDNATINVLLNGITTGIPQTTYAAFSPLTTISSGFHSGVNTLTFVTDNFPQPPFNPSGLRVEVTGTALPIPEPSSLALLLTGIGLTRLLAARNRVS